MAETLTIRTASSTEIVKIAVPGPQGPKGDKGDPGDVAGLPLSTLGDTLYRGASQNERLPIGSTGQILKVSAQGLPTWANESGAVTSVNGQTGAVTVSVPTASSSTPSALGVAAVGTSSDFSRADHVHAMPSAADVGLGSEDSPTFASVTLTNTGTDGDNLLGCDDQGNIYRVTDGNFDLSAAYANLGLGTAAAADSADFAAANHAAAHASAGSDPLAPSDIGAQSLFTSASQVLSADFTLTSGRATKWTLQNYNGTTYNVTLPTTNIQAGDVVVIAAGTLVGSQTIREANVGGGSFATLATLSAGQSYRFISTGTSSNSWEIDQVYTHNHAASAITSGTLSHERGGLEADVSAYSGLVKISSGSTSAVTVTSAGEALLDDADAAAQRTTLGLGTAATAATGDFAAASHSHELTALAATGATNGHVLTANGSNGVTFAALPASGVSSVSSSASDVLGVSGANITGVDANADRIIFFDDSAGKLTHLTVGSGLSISDTTISATATGTIGGSTSTDNAIVRADSTSNTVQDSALVIDDATTSTQANVALRNNHSETNSALVLCNKGTGAFIVSPARPDGTSSGGNARGVNSVCINPSRTAATQVASGSGAVAIGRAATASGTDAISILAASASGNESVAIGLLANGGALRAVAICREATATGEGCVAIGNSATASTLGAVSIGYAPGTASLRHQFLTKAFSCVYWSGQTTNNTATILNLDGTATNRFTIAANTALAVDILLVARRSDTADKWLVARRFLGIRRDGSNNTSLIGTVQDYGLDQSAGSPTWSFTLTADDTNEALQLEVTGAASETVQWRATAFYRVV